MIEVSGRPKTLLWQVVVGREILRTDLETLRIAGEPLQYIMFSSWKTVLGSSKLFPPLQTNDPCKSTLLVLLLWKTNRFSPNTRNLCKREFRVRSAGGKNNIDATKMAVAKLTHDMKFHKLDPSKPSPVPGTSLEPPRSRSSQRSNRSMSSGTLD